MLKKIYTWTSRIDLKNFSATVITNYRQKTTNNNSFYSCFSTFKLFLPCAL